MGTPVDTGLLLIAPDTYIKGGPLWSTSGTIWIVVAVVGCHPDCRPGRFRGRQGSASTPPSASRAVARANQAGDGQARTARSAWARNSRQGARGAGRSRGQGRRSRQAAGASGSTSERCGDIARAARGAAQARGQPRPERQDATGRIVIKDTMRSSTNRPLNAGAVRHDLHRFHIGLQIITVASKTRGGTPTCLRPRLAGWPAPSTGHPGSQV